MGSKKTEVVKNLAVIMAGIFLVAVVVEAAWAPPTIAPPDGNVSAPINVSNTVQIKTGSFTSGGLGSTGGIVANNTISSGVDIRAPLFYDSNNIAYYVDPASTSYVNDLRANIMYDRNDTNYYVDPAGTSRFNQINLGGVTRSSWPTAPAETDPTVPASIKDGISWGEVSGKPTPIFRVYEKVCQNCSGTLFCCNNYATDQMVSGGFSGGPQDCAGGKGWICGAGICYIRCGYVTW